MEEGEDEFQNVVRLGFVSFFTDVSSEMVFSMYSGALASVAILGMVVFNRGSS